MDVAIDYFTIQEEEVERLRWFTVEEIKKWEFEWFPFSDNIKKYLEDFAAM
jgi:hypothetical protein